MNEFEIGEACEVREGDVWHRARVIERTGPSRDWAGGRMYTARLDGTGEDVGALRIERGTIRRIEE
jgi:hypothetical protein